MMTQGGGAGGAKATGQCPACRCNHSGTRRYRSCSERVSFAICEALRGRARHLPKAVSATCPAAGRCRLASPVAEVCCTAPCATRRRKRAEEEAEAQAARLQRIKVRPACGAAA